MKRILKPLGICLAIAALASSCAKERNVIAGPDGGATLDGGTPVRITVTASGQTTTQGTQATQPGSGATQNQPGSGTTQTTTPGAQPTQPGSGATPAAQTPATKTYIDGDEIKWSPDYETLCVYEQMALDEHMVVVSTRYTDTGVTTDGGQTMTFGFTSYSHNGVSYTYYGVYPYNAHVSLDDERSLTPVLETPYDQYPFEGSFDANADLLISAPVPCGDTIPTEFNMSFARVVSIAKMTLSGLPATASISWVEFSTDKPLAGQTTFDLTTGDPVTDFGDVHADTTILVSTRSPEVIFTSYPFDLAAGDKFTVTVETSLGRFTRTVTIPSGRQLRFRSGKAAVFSVDMSLATSSTSSAWTKHTGALAEDDYLVVYNGKAMTAGVTSNRLDYTEVTVSGGQIETDDANLIWHIAPTAGGTWTIYNAAQNRYAASNGTKNQAALVSSRTEKAFWTVEAGSGDTFEFTNTANSASGVNAILRNNGTYGFACYSSSTGGPLTLYRMGSRHILSAPATVSASLNPSNPLAIDVTFSAVNGAASYVIVATPEGGTAITKPVVSSPAQISSADGLTAETTYSIAAYAVPSDAAHYTISAATPAAGTVTTGSAPAVQGTVLAWAYTATVTEGYEFIYAANSGNGCYQDGGSVGDIRYVGAKRSTAIFSEAPSAVTIYATLGGGTVNNSLGNSVYACYVDADGNDIAGSAVELTSAITSTTGSEFSADMSTTLATSAYGVKIYHEKESGYNVRYFSFHLTAGGGGSSTPGATASVTTGAAHTVTGTAAVLTGSFVGATGTIYECGFYWGESSDNLSETIETDGSNLGSGNFSCSIGGLSNSTTYYYKAYVLEYNQTTSQYEERFGSVRSFTTTDGSGGGLTAAGWLELPSQTGSEDYVGTFYGDGSFDGQRDYTYYYDYTMYAAMWVAYPLCSAHLGNGRSGSWALNPNIPSQYQIHVQGKSYGSNYGASEYSRGHQIPNADRNGNDTMQGHTFLVTNQTPQLQNGFNGGIWNSLEEGVRGAATSSGDTLYVATGPVYRKVGGSETITYLHSTGSATPATVPVPNYYWKAVLKVRRDAHGDLIGALACGFWFEHRAYSGSSYENCAVSVDQIEAWTGLDLFTNLPASLQTTAETNSDWSTFRAY